MSTPSRPVTILVAEDDPDDRLVLEEAMREAHVEGPLLFAVDGEEALSRLRDFGSAAPRPGFLLLDLRMPRRDGFELLAAIRGDAELRTIPAVVLTTSADPDDVRRCYELGASAYITKPSSFDALVEVMRSLKRFWIETATLP